MMTLKGIILPPLEWYIKHIFQNYQPWKVYLSNGLLMTNNARNNVWSKISYSVSVMLKSCKMYHLLPILEKKIGIAWM